MMLVESGMICRCDEPVLLFAKPVSRQIEQLPNLSHTQHERCAKKPASGDRDRNRQLENFFPQWQMRDTKKLVRHRANSGDVSGHGKKAVLVRRAMDHAGDHGLVVRPRGPVCRSQTGRG